MRIRVLGQRKGLVGSCGPSCHLVDICGVRLLLECPFDLSALQLFLPAVLPHEPNSKKAPLVGDLINEPPWYKTADLGMVDVALLDAVIISNPSAMLALPLIARMPEFNAKIYATDVTAKFGRMMMEELIAGQKEYTDTFGRLNCEKTPAWIYNDALPSEIQNFIRGDDGVDIINWNQLYSAEDLKSCMEKVQPLRYGEEVIVGDSLVIKASSSGFLGASNWVMKAPWMHLTYMATSTTIPSHAACLNMDALEGGHILLFSDVQAINACKNDYLIESKVNKTPFILGNLNNHDASSASPKMSTALPPWRRSQTLANGHAKTEAEMVPTPTSEQDWKNNILFACKAAADAVRSGNSVLIPIGPSGLLLELLEEVAAYFLSASLGHIPMIYISPVADEFLAYTNTIPEWLSPPRQQKLYAGESLFAHVDLLKQKKLFQFSTLSSPDLLGIWQEPSVIFCTHASLRMGPAVQLLQRWQSRTGCLVILTECIGDAEMMLSAFQPSCFRVLQLPLVSGLRMNEVATIIGRLQPKLAIVPQSLKSLNIESGSAIAFYSAEQSFEIPDTLQAIQINMCADLALQARSTALGSLDVAHLAANLDMRNGKFIVEKAASSKFSHDELRKYRCYWGTVNMEMLFQALRDRGLSDFRVTETSEFPSASTITITFHFPSIASIELKPNVTHIKSDEPAMQKLLNDAITSILQVT